MEWDRLFFIKLLLGSKKQDFIHLQLMSVLITDVASERQVTYNSYFLLGIGFYK